MMYNCCVNLLRSSLNRKGEKGANTRKNKHDGRKHNGQLLFM